MKPEITAKEISHLKTINNGIRLILSENEKHLLRNIVMDAKALYDGYPSKHQSEIYLFIKALLRIL